MDWCDPFLHTLNPYRDPITFCGSSLPWLEGPWIPKTPMLLDGFLQRNGLNCNNFSSRHHHNSIHTSVSFDQLTWIFPTIGRTIGEWQDLTVQAIFGSLKLKPGMESNTGSPGPWHATAWPNRLPPPGPLVNHERTSEWTKRPQRRWTWTGACNTSTSNMESGWFKPIPPRTLRTRTTTITYDHHLRPPRRHLLSIRVELFTIIVGDVRLSTPSLGTEQVCCAAAKRHGRRSSYPPNRCCKHDFNMVWRVDTCGIMIIWVHLVWIWWCCEQYSIRSDITTVLSRS